MDELTAAFRRRSVAAHSASSLTGMRLETLPSRWPDQFDKVKEMRRAIHMAVTIVSVLLLLTPYDCLAAITTPKAADCCAKGKCLPTRDADECCKNTAPSASQLLAAKPDHASVPVPHSCAVDLHCALPSFVPISRRYPVAAFAPPGSPPGLRRNLPLLI